MIVNDHDINMIEWRIVSFAPNYELSEYGHVRRIGRAMGATTGAILCPKKHKYGYPRYDLRINGESVGFEVHRLVARVFIGERPSKIHIVAHYDGNPNNNHYSNLRWATQTENMADAGRHGTLLRGSKNPMAKLTKQEVDEIRILREIGYTQKSIANEFGVSFQNISKIINRSRWQ